MIVWGPQKKTSTIMNVHFSEKRLYMENIRKEISHYWFSEDRLCYPGAGIWSCVSNGSALQH